MYYFIVYVWYFKHVNFLWVEKIFLLTYVSLLSSYISVFDIIFQKIGGLG